MARSDKAKAKPKEKRKNKRGDNQIAPPPPQPLPPVNSYGDTVSCSNPFDDNNSSYMPRQMPPQPPGPPPMTQQLPPPPPPPMGMNQPPGGNPMAMGYQTGPMPNQGPPMRMPLSVNQSPTHPNQIRYNNAGKPPPMGLGGRPMQSASPGHSGYGGPMQSPSPGQHGGYGGMPNAPPPRPMGDMSGMMYLPLIRNSQNQNAPPIYACGGCRREIAENEAALLCESGCNFWYHKQCSGLSDDAYNMIKADFLVEWACDQCFSRGGVPLFKFKP
ncbi:uncharacterized protein LOC141853545 [Brevipalpus obovatus]|uniref:uncharacterized protein LOC141853545 n=1 Tax=Brevipalpus obovatus TaxID=246614 RepID=UPI003D9ECB06